MQLFNQKVIHWFINVIIYSSVGGDGPAPGAALHHIPAQPQLPGLLPAQGHGPIQGEGT